MLSLRRGVQGRPRASVLLWAFLCATLIDFNTSVPVDKCPRTLDCTLEGRHFCQPGSAHCGPCLAPLEENKEGKCVTKKRHGHFGTMSTRPELDEEIDFLSSIISKQRGSEVKQSAPSQKVHKSKQEAPKRKTVAHDTVAQATVGLPVTTSPPTPPPQTVTLHEPEARMVPVAVPVPNLSKDTLLVVMIGVCIIVGTAALILAGICWVRIQREMHLAQKVEYPGFSVMAPHSFDNTLPGDKKLARSAQMYHYQHQKQQMLSLEKHRDEPKIPDSGTTSDEENEDGDFTVYECPGLAPTGEMEVKNPLFDDSTLHIQRNHNSVKVFKYTDDTTIVCLISDNNETLYRQEVVRAWFCNRRQKCKRLALPFEDECVGHPYHEQSPPSSTLPGQGYPGSSYSGLPNTLCILETCR
ncbi:hypothetical protein SKAU_G00004640 [Synaphobranchus kaupii]|uniref:Neural proliferation differentiation and control protein 1 n=1 Tax=Synaphobranchus kaupii TaxID=118154 RepID=A0A9Q1GA13_SYNKA|nr:hypothetical protein SKAU_G00004640 [Synaphobranchus kaupii]